MMKYLLIAFFLLTHFVASSQHKHDYNWVFGWQNSPNSSGTLSSQLNFNETPLSIIDDDIALELYVTNTTMSDKEGNLIFYTNGCDIANANHEIMENGTGLNPGLISNEWCNSAYPSAFQSCISIPAPGHDSLYYLFHKSVIPENGTVYADKLYYTTIDMTYNNGLGKVVEKNTVLREGFMRSTEMTMIKHEDQESWWLFNADKESNNHFMFLIKSDTIEGPFEQSIGLSDAIHGGGSGSVIFTPNGEKFIRSNRDDHLYIYDFDRGTGMLSNFQQILVDVDTLMFQGSCTVSPNSKFLYVSTLGWIHQFDLEADDIKASQELIATFNGSDTFYSMQLGPDCRIFINSRSSGTPLHIIHQPNEKGQACNFEDSAIILPNPYNLNMPHFPYYRMDTDDPICDTSLVVTSTEQFRPLRQQVSIFPNPTHGPIHIHLPILPDQPMRIAVFNAFGQVVWSAERRTGDAEQQVDLSGLAAGVYVVQVDMGSAGRVTEKVILK